MHVEKKSMKFVVTDGTGFIGIHITKFSQKFNLFFTRNVYSTFNLVKMKLFSTLTSLIHFFTSFVECLYAYSG